VNPMVMKQPNKNEACKELLDNAHAEVIKNINTLNVSLNHRGLITERLVYFFISRIVTRGAVADGRLQQSNLETLQI